MEGSLKRIKYSTRFPSNAELCALIEYNSAELLDARLADKTAANAFLDANDRNTVFECVFSKDVLFLILLELNVTTIIELLCTSSLVYSLVFDISKEFWYKKAQKDFPEIFFIPTKKTEGFWNWIASNVLERKELSISKTDYYVLYHLISSVRKKWLSKYYRVQGNNFFQLFEWKGNNNIHRATYVTNTRYLLKDELVPWTDAFNFDKTLINDASTGIGYFFENDGYIFLDVSDIYQLMQQYIICYLYNKKSMIRLRDANFGIITLSGLFIHLKLLKTFYNKL